MQNDTDPMPRIYEELDSAFHPTGIEAEEITGSESNEILEPFDPEKIEVRTKPMTVDLLMRRLQENEIDLEPDFQRRAGIWDKTRQSRLIESLLLRIPLPVFYFAADAKDRWAVVDGLQRLSTLKSFINDKPGFPLTGLEFLSNLRGQRYGDLSRAFQRRINETELTVNVIEPGTPEPVMFNIFKRINTGGMPLSDQEIRHAIYRGKSTTLLKRLAATNEFKQATDQSIRDERMADRECILRFLSFSVTPWHEYNSRDLSGWLADSMLKINRLDDARILELEASFKKAMRAARAIFGRHAFRKYYGDKGTRSPINKALFEIWAYHLSCCTEEQIRSLELKRDMLLDDWAVLLLSDINFSQSISVGTGLPAAVRERFSRVGQFIQEHF